MTPGCMCCKDTRKCILKNDTPCWLHTKFCRRKQENVRRRLTALHISPSDDDVKTSFKTGNVQIVVY